MVNNVQIQPGQHLARNKTGSFGFLLSSMLAYKYALGACIVVSLLAASIDLGMTYIIQQSINLTGTSQSQEIYRMLMYMAGLIAGGMLVKFITKILSVRISSHMIKDLQSQLINKVVKLPYSYLHSRQTGSVVSLQSSDFIQIQNFLQNDLFNLFYYPLIMLGSICYMAILSWKLLLFCTFITPISIVLIVLISKPISRRILQLQEDVGNSNAIVHDAIAGISTLKAYRLQSLFSGKYRRAIDSVMSHTVAIEKRRALSSPFIVILQLVPFIFCIVYGGYLSFHGIMTIGALAGFIQLLNYLIQPSSQLPMLINNFRGVLGTLTHVEELLTYSEERSDGKDMMVNSQAEPLEFKQLHFSYNPEQPVLNGINLCLRKNSVTAIVGPSGSGKSTIFKLISGFYEADDGELLLFGERIQSINLASIRSQIAFVPQKSQIFPASVAENISYGKPDASREEIIEAARLANAHEFIAELPNGYDTVMGEQGVGMSGGQKQRVALARAILKDVPILLLDEATSALDAMSESLIQKSIGILSRNKTIVIVAHRLSTVEHADQIIVLDQGKIVERGTHSELLIRKGLYASLYEQDHRPGSKDQNGGAYAAAEME